MIVRADTPKGLSWSGRTTVLAIAAFVLPLAPSWAQNHKSTSTKPDRLAVVGPNSSAENERSQPVDPRRVAAKKPLSIPEEQYENLRKIKHDQLLARLTKDDKKKDDDKGEKASEAMERLQEKVKELLDKLGKELSPVAEEVRKTLEQAVGDIHKSLEKEGLSPDDLRKAFDKAQQDLRKAFEGGGAVDKELREVIEKTRKDVQEAFDRTRGDVQNQVDGLRPRSRESTEEEPRDKGRYRDVEKEPSHNALDSARQEIRNLEQRLRAATRRLELLEQRESRGGSPSRRPEPKGTAPAPVSPRIETLRPQIPARPPTAETGRGRGRGGMMGRPQSENDRRLRELEDKMNLLLKELERLKGNKNPQ